MMRKILVTVMVACILLGGCGSAKAEQTTTTAEQTTTTAEQATTTAEQATTTAEQATTTTEQAAVEAATTASTADTSVIKYIIVYDDGTEVTLFIEGDEAFFFENGGRTNKENLPGIKSLPPEGGKVKRKDIKGEMELLDFIKANAY